MDVPPRLATCAVRRSRVFTRISSAVVTVSLALDPDECRFRRNVRDVAVSELLLGIYPHSVGKKPFRAIDSLVYRSDTL
jgi:hypothetical protein